MDNSTENKVNQATEQELRGWDKYINRLRESIDLEVSAKAQGAFQRRRKVTRAIDLLRMVLAYAVCDWPLWLIGLWSGSTGIGRLSSVAVMKRLQKCEAWLKELIAVQLSQKWDAGVGVRLRIVDGSGVSRPGSKGTDWRIHLGIDLSSMSITNAEISDASGAESLSRFPLDSREIVIGDRGYAYRTSFGAYLAQKCSFILRCNWSNVPLWHGNGERVDMEKVLSRLRPGEVVEYPVWVVYDDACYPVRLVIGALPRTQAEEARRKLYTSYKGKLPKRATVLAAGCTLLLSNLPRTAWPAQHLLKMYGWRWQVELYFKRLKSIWHMDKLRAKDSKLANVYLLAKLLAVLLMEPIHQEYRSTLEPSPHTWSRPVSEWKLSKVTFEIARQSIIGPEFMSRLWDVLSLDPRYFKRSPRRRANQLALAVNRLLAFSPAGSV